MYPLSTGYTHRDTVRHEMCYSCNVLISLAALAAVTSISGTCPHRIMRDLKVWGWVPDHFSHYFLEILHCWVILTCTICTHRSCIRCPATVRLLKSQWGWWGIYQASLIVSVKVVLSGLVWTVQLWQTYSHTINYHCEQLWVKHAASLEQRKCLNRLKVVLVLCIHDPTPWVKLSSVSSIKAFSPPSLEASLCGEQPTVYNSALVWKITRSRTNQKWRAGWHTAVSHRSVCCSGLLCKVLQIWCLLHYEFSN